MMPTTNPHVAGHCTRAVRLTSGGSYGFIEQSCCAPAAPTPERRVVSTTADGPSGTVLPAEIVGQQGNAPLEVVQARSSR
jgi:hypothetical protein